MNPIQNLLATVWHAPQWMLLAALSMTTHVVDTCRAEEENSKNDYAAELPRVPVLEPIEAMKRIEVAEGFEIH